LYFIVQIHKEKNNMKKIVLLTITIGLLMTACAVPLTVDRVGAAAIETGSVETPVNTSENVSAEMVDW